MGVDGVSVCVMGSSQDSIVEDEESVAALEARDGGREGGREGGEGGEGGAE